MFNSPGPQYTKAINPSEEKSKRARKPRFFFSCQLRLTRPKSLPLGREWTVRPDKKLQQIQHSNNRSH